MHLLIHLLFQMAVFGVLESLNRLFKIFNDQVGTISEAKFSDDAPLLVREDTDSLVGPCSAVIISLIGCIQLFLV